MLLPIKIKNANDFGVLNMDEEQSFHAICLFSFSFYMEISSLYAHLN